MSPTVHFYAADTRHIFNIIGSADRDVLNMIGVHPGREFLPYEDEDEEPFAENEETEMEEDWDADEEEANAAREALMKVITDGVPADLSEEEAYGIQEFFAGYAQQTEALEQIDLDDLVTADESLETEVELAEEIRDLVLSGAEIDDVYDVIEALREANASPELLSRLQILCRGRLPEADEPTFTDLETDAYGARFGYILAREAAQIANEMREAVGDSDDPTPRLLAALLDYSVSSSLDLVVTIED